MAYSYADYTADGKSGVYTIPFPYLTPDTLHVFVKGVEQVPETGYTVDRVSATVTLAEPPLLADAVRIRRITPTETNKLIVTFRDGAQLDAFTQNLSQFQLLYILQEFVDRVITGTGGDGILEGGINSGTGSDALAIPPAVSVALDELQQLLDSTTATALAEHNARVADLESKLDALVAGLGDKGTALVNLINTEIGSNVAGTSTITGILSRLGTAESRLATEETSRATNDSALSSRVGVVEASLDTPSTGIKARLTSEETARATSDSAQATRISTLESNVNDPATGLAKAHSRITDVSSSIVQGVAGDVTAMALRVSTLESDIADPATGNAALYSKVSDEAATRTTNDSTLAGRISTVETGINDPATGLAKAHSKVADEVASRTTADTALAGRTSTLESTINDSSTGLAATRARIAAEEVTRANAVSAVGSRTSSIEAQVGNSTTGLEAAFTRIAAEESVRASADLGLSNRTTTLESSVNNATTGLAATYAKVGTEESARTSGDVANAQSISSVQAVINNATTGLASAHSKVTTEATARATADGYLSGKYTIQVDTNGRVAGMNISSATSNGTSTSLISFLADVFKVFNGATDEAVFEVSGGAVRIKCLVAGNVSTFAQRFNPETPGNTFPSVARAGGDIGNVGYSSIPEHGTGNRYYTTSDSLIFNGWNRGSTGFATNRFGNGTQHFLLTVSGNAGNESSSDNSMLILNLAYRTRSNGGAWSDWTSMAHDNYVTRHGDKSVAMTWGADLRGLNGASDVQFAVRLSRSADADNVSLSGCYMQVYAYN